MERDGAQVMEQREKVARAIAKATIGDDVAINREGFSRQHYYEVADAVLLALGLGEGGENVIVPKEPTEAMLVAAEETIVNAYSGSDWEEAKDMAEGLDGLPIYRAMLGARP